VGVLGGVGVGVGVGVMIGAGCSSKAPASQRDATIVCGRGTPRWSVPDPHGLTTPVGKTPGVAMTASTAALPGPRACVSAITVGRPAGWFSASGVIPGSTSWRSPPDVNPHDVPGYSKLLPRETNVPWQFEPVRGFATMLLATSKVPEPR
jgi:hypothetical protein